MIGRDKTRRLFWALLNLLGALCLAALATSRLQAEGAATSQALTAETASAAFAAHCFSPFMTAVRAGEVLTLPGARVEFYDLDPFSDAEPSPVTGRPATPGTDRRCEIAFDGAHSELAVAAAVGGLEAEGIRTEAPLPEGYSPTDGTALLAARQLNPARVAVVHVGTRPGPNGIETFLFVERLMPSGT